LILNDAFDVLRSGFQVVNQGFSIVDVGGDIADAAGGVVDDGNTVAGQLAGFHGHAVGFGGTVGHVVHADGHLLYRGGHIGRGAALLAGGTGYLAGVLRQGFGHAGNGQRATVDFVEAVLQAGQQFVHGVGHLAQLVIAGDLDTRGEVQLAGDVVDKVAQPVQAVTQVADGDAAKHQAEHDGQRADGNLGDQQVLVGLLVFSRSTSPSFQL
jgi:hypothetical protein